MTDVLHEGGGVTVRVATKDDSEALCDLLRRVHIRSSLDITQERDPDFFRLLDMHLGDYEVLIAEGRDGRAGACGALSIRPGWVDGRIRSVGYLGDLRIVPGSRAAAVMPKVFTTLLERARDRFGAEHFYTVIFDENEAAKRALVSRTEKRKDLPIYRVMTPFDMTNVQFTLSKRKPRSPVERAKPSDLDELIAFISEQARSRVMGDPADAERIAKRFSTWPKLGVESFLVAKRSGRIAGCAAPFDTDPFKRTRVLGYYHRMRWVRAAFNLGSKLFRYTPLPEPNATFRFAFLSHLEIRDDDPAILHDLLLEAYRVLSPQGLHFMSAMIPKGSRLSRAFDGFTVNRTPMTIYSVVLAGGPHRDTDFRTLRPGFEMALS